MSATNNYAFLIIAFILLSIGCSLPLYAEGTKRLSPTVNDRVNLNFNITGYNSFGRYDGVDNQQLYIHIDNPATEQVFLGFSQPRSAVSYPCAAGNATAYFRIKDPNGNVVFPTAGSPNGEFSINAAIKTCSQSYTEVSQSYMLYFLCETSVKPLCNSVSNFYRSVKRIVSPNGQLIAPLVANWANAVAVPNQGSRLLTISSPNGTVSCGVSVLMEAACKAEGGRIGQ